ncbi:MAG: CAP domain-containing protein [Candidatus Dormibacteria bacterium]
MAITMGLLALIGAPWVPALGAAVGIQSVMASQSAQPAWLTEINLYRQAGGLAPVVDQAAWDVGIQAHLNYLADTPPSYFTGEYASLHTENPASPYYTSAGAQEAAASDLFTGAMGYTPLQYIDGWLAAPFHAVGILRPNLTAVAFAYDPATGDAGLDVISGLNYTLAAPTVPTLFPGSGMTTDLTSFQGESPTPLQTCGWSVGAGSYGVPAPPPGLPLIALLTQPPSPGLSAELTASDGSSQSSAGGTLCIVDENTYYSSDPIYGPTGLQILQGNNVVVLIPKTPLTWARYTVTITQPGQTDITWSFIATPAGPVLAGHTVVVHVTGSSASAVFGNLTVVKPSAAGYAEAYPCGSARPTASNINYVAGETVANAVTVQPDTNGDICLYTSASTDLIWDQVASTTAVSAQSPVRLLDTRASGNRPAAGGVIAVHVAASSASAVFGNLTVVNPSAAGYAEAYPCGSARPTASNVNYVAGETVANAVTVQPDANGDICLYTSASTDLIWDQVASTTAVSAQSPVRLLDTRSPTATIG